MQLGHRGREAGPDVELVLAIGDDDEQRRVAGGAREVLEHSQRRAVGPMHVVEHEQHGARPAGGDEQVEHRAVQAVALRRRIALHGRGEAGQMARNVGKHAGQLAGAWARRRAQRVGVEVLHQMGEGLDEGLVGRGQVRVASAVEHDRALGAGRARELPGQPRLARARLAPDERDATAAVVAGVAPEPAEGRQLHAAAHERQRRSQAQGSGQR